MTELQHATFRIKIPIFIGFQRENFSLTQVKSPYVQISLTHEFKYVLSAIYQIIVQHFRNEYDCTQCTYDKITVGFNFIIFEGKFFLKKLCERKK